MRKDHPGAYKWKTSTSKNAQQWISSSNSLDTVYEVTLGKNKDNYLPHMAKYFCQSLSTERMWLLCLCQDAVTESTSSSLHGKGLIIGYLLADSFWKGQEITFCDTQPGFTCVQTAQFLKQSNLIHCITLAIQKARGQIPVSEDLCQRCCGQSNSLHSEQS